MNGIFLNANHDLRSGWKFGVYCVLFLLIWFAAGVAISIVVAQMGGALLENQLALLGLNEAALFAPAVGAMLLAVHFVDHRPLRTFGIGFVPQWRRHLASGLVVAAAMLAFVTAACYAVGFVVIHWTGNQVPLGTLAATLGFLLVAALNEELVFRGFPLQVLMEGMGEWPAIVTMSVLFGALHLNNPNSTMLGVLNTVVAGILLSLAYARTRSLWLPYAIHAGWNIGLGFVLGFPLSGIDLASLWTSGTAGSETILGGGYGPEGGLIATFVFATAALFLNKYGSDHRTKTDAGRNIGRRSGTRAANPR